MVKVVGKDDSAIKRITCQGCASVLEYMNFEIKRRDGHDYTGGADGEEWVNCPKCGNKAIIDSW